MIYSQHTVNLHTHTVYSGHGIGSVAEVVEEARKETELEVLGFSEHSINPDSKLYLQRTEERIVPYLAELNEAIAKENERNPVETVIKDNLIQANPGRNLLILKGLEVTWEPEYEQTVKEWKERYCLDYMLGSVHNYYDKDAGKKKHFFYGRSQSNVMSQMISYADRYCKMLQSGLFVLGCHPDIFMASVDWNKDLENISKDIIECAKECNLPLEINANGMCGSRTMLRADGMRNSYPFRNFWILAKEAGVKICCNADSHSPESLQNFNAAISYANALEIELVKWEIDKDNRIIRAI